MAIIGEFKSLLELAEKAAAKAREVASEKNLNAVLIAIHKNGGCASAEELEKIGFTKLQIIKAVEMGSLGGFLTDASTMDGMAWCLSQKGDYYVRALLESQENR